MDKGLQWAALLHPAIFESRSDLDFRRFRFIASVQVAQEIALEFEIVTAVTAEQSTMVEGCGTAIDKNIA